MSISPVIQYAVVYDTWAAPRYWAARTSAGLAVLVDIGDFITGMKMITAAVDQLNAQVVAAVTASSPPEDSHGP